MIYEEFLRNIDRRSFLKIVSLTGITGLIYPRKLLASLVGEELSRVIIVEDGTATDGSSINEDTVQIMMDTGVKALTYQCNVGEAWKMLFPGITSSSVIAIKVNCINSSCPTHPEVTNTVVNGLKQMVVDSAPFEENNIIIFDRSSGELQASGYTINASGTGVRCYGTSHFPNNYSEESYDVHGVSLNLSKIVTELADYLIDISVMKNHDNPGVTLCLKNNLGTCNSPSSLHPTNCNPYIPALNALPPITNKQCVNICDALFGIYTGGPGGYPQFAANTIIISQDVVAADYWGRQILEDNGCTTISNAYHIDTAAQDPYNLGTNDPSQMEVINIIDPATGIDSPENIIPQDGVLLQQNRPNPFSSSTQIRFYLAKPERIEMTIYDVAGRRVRKLINETLGSGWRHVQWDGYNNSGRHVSSGIYYCQLRTDTFKKAIIMQVVR